MKKQISLTLFLMLMAIAGLLSTCDAQSQHVESFFRDLKRDPVPVTITIDSIKNVFVFGEHLPANGAIKKTSEGYAITIDAEFYSYCDTKRLIYFLLAHEVLGLPKGKGLMNENLVYKPLRQRDIKL